jgi:transglutaminase-like putative cysteine protease
VTWFQIVEPHESLVVEAEATVVVRRPQPAERRVSPDDEWRALADAEYRDTMAEYLAPSTFAAPGEDVVALAAELAISEYGGVGHWLVDLSHAVAGAIAYEPGATSVDTPASEVARLRRGVCQDLAHVSIALCRLRGVPARYVSGWLHYAGADGPGESHAWIEAHTPNEGWIPLDPTHPASGELDHVPVAVGRDYADVPPIRGSYRGAPAEGMTVWVDIREEAVPGVAAPL